MSLNLPAGRSDADLLEELSLLATEKSGERRRELLSSVADLFYQPTRDIHTDSERQVFADVVGRLLKDVSVEGRLQFSARVADDNRTPRDVALTLANDTIEVAQPVITNSAALSESDLVEIASSKTMEHRLAISKRENITETISDTLIGFGEFEVAESLTENITAAISQNGFSRIGDMSKERPSLRKKLSVREDLPIKTAHDILPYLAPADADKLLALMGVDGADQLKSLLDRATPELVAQRAARARRRIGVKALMNGVTAGKLYLDDAISQLIVGGQVLDVALGLSLASDLPEQQVINAIVSVRMEPLALICKAINIPEASYVGADVLRTQSVNLPKVSPDTLRSAYAKLTPDAAARSIRFVKVRNNVSTAS